MNTTNDIQLIVLILQNSTQWSLVSSGIEDNLFESTLQHVTAKFAHMNGHWKAYDFKN